VRTGLTLSLQPERATVISRMVAHSHR